MSEIFVDVEDTGAFQVARWELKSRGYAAKERGVPVVACSRMAGGGTVFFPAEGTLSPADLNIIDQMGASPENPLHLKLIFQPSR